MIKHSNGHVTRQSRAIQAKRGDQSPRYKHCHGWSEHGLTPTGGGLAVAIVAWSIAWKGASLWRASKEDSKPWFITLLLANTAGILDAIYLFGVTGAHRRRTNDEESILSTTGEPQQLGHPQET